MKRFLLIAFLSILCVTASISQIDQGKYNMLVDYVNCRYTVVYINEKKSEIKNKGYLNDFEKYKKSFDNSVKSYVDIYKGFDKTVQNSASIYDALKKSAKGFTKAEALWQFIDDKKENFSSDWTKEQMIDYLVLLSDDAIMVSGQKINFKSFLAVTTNSLKKELTPQTLDNISETDEEIMGEVAGTKETEIKTIDVTYTTDLESKVIKKDSGTNQEKDNNRRVRGQDTNKGKSKFPFGNIIIIVVLAVLGYFGYKKQQSVKNFINRFKSNSAEKEEPSNINYQKKIKELQLENLRLRSLEQDNEQLHKRVKQLEQSVREHERKSPQKTESTKGQPQRLVIPVKKEEKQVTVNATCLYADAIIDNKFHRISEQPNEDTVYELLRSSSARTARFRVFTGAYKRVIETPDFVEGCDKQKINAQPQTLEFEYGEAIQDDYGKWKVTKKAIIKFV